MSSTIKHIGMVERVETDRLVVRIPQTDACTGCKAASICHADGCRSQLVEVLKPSGLYQAGDRILIEGKPEESLWAVAIAYIIPLILTVVVLVIGCKYMNEPSAALLTLVTVAAYYALLATQKNRLNRKFTFRIINETE